MYTIESISIGVLANNGLDVSFLSSSYLFGESQVCNVLVVHDLADDPMDDDDLAGIPLFGNGMSRTPLAGEVLVREVQPY